MSVKLHPSLPHSHPFISTLMEAYIAVGIQLFSIIPKHYIKHKMKMHLGEIIQRNLLKCFFFEDENAGSIYG